MCYLYPYKNVTLILFLTDKRVSAAIMGLHTGSFDVEDTTTLSWSSAAVSE